MTDKEGGSQIASQTTGVNYMEPSRTSLYTIPIGTILYHGSLNRESFNPYDIRLGNDKLVSYFSTNRRLASDYIVGCALYPTKTGFLHKFVVKKPIEKILIVSAYDKQPHWTLNFIEDSFCSRKFRIPLDGVGFFFPRQDQSNTDNIVHDPEFALCNPNLHLEYVSTQKCISMRKLGLEENFAK